MKRVYLDKKGFTLVELIIVIAIMGMVMASLGSYFLFNINLFYRTNDDMMLQDEMQKAVNTIIDLSMEAKGIDDTLSIINEEGETEKIVFIRAGSKSNVVIQFKDHKLFYGYGETEDEEKADHEFASHITTFIVKASEGGAYKDTKGITFEITAESNRAKAEAKNNQVCFRNAE